MSRTDFPGQCPGHTRESETSAHFSALLSPMVYLGEAICTGVDAVVRAISRGLKSLRIRRQEQASIHAVSGLDDHMLKDIGICRSQIHYLARMSARNPGIDYRMSR